jgi:hypothetical protein
MVNPLTARAAAVADNGSRHKRREAERCAFSTWGYAGQAGAGSRARKDPLGNGPKNRF